MGNVFKIKKGDIDRVSKTIVNSTTRERGILTAKVNNITNVIYQTAHSKRAIITKAEMRESGRSKRVSDPGAPSGVPVDTGSLQSAIRKSVSDNGKKITGMVYIDEGASNSESGVPVMKYAEFMEYGTSRIAPRSFIRTAIRLNSDWIRRYFKQKQ